MTIVGVICLGLMTVTGLLCIVRIVRGPATLDRAVASDVFLASSVGVVGIEAALGQHTTTLTMLVALAMLGFLGSVAIARVAASDAGPAAPEDQS